MSDQNKIRIGIWFLRRPWGRTRALATEEGIRAEAIVECIFEEGLDGLLGALEKRNKEKEQ